jgi:hypothetical protein
MFHTKCRNKFWVVPDSVSFMTRLRTYSRICNLVAKIGHDLSFWMLLEGWDRQSEEIWKLQIVKRFGN